MSTTLDLMAHALAGSIHSRVTINSLAQGCFIAAMLWMIYRQVRPREMRRRAHIMYALCAALAVSALWFGYSIYEHPIGWRSALLLGTSFVLLGLGMGIARAYTIKLRRMRAGRDGTGVHRQGTVWTVILWIIAVGLHTTVNYLVHADLAGIALYLAFTFTVQALVIRRRVRALLASGVAGDKASADNTPSLSAR